MPAELGLIERVPAFQELSDKQRRGLTEKLHAVSFPAGHVIFEYGDPGRTMFIICDGEVEAFVADDTGHRIVLETAGPGEFFGELSMLDSGPRPASVVVTRPLEALAVDREAFDFALATFPGAAHRLLEALGKRLRASSDLLRHTATRNVNREAEETRGRIQRVADWISEFSGSLTFLFIHLAFFAVWIGVNLGMVPIWPKFDAFPFGLLTLIVSLESIILSVFVMLSQNREAVKERVRSDIEYDVNLKAEREVAHLHEKVDRLTSGLFARLDAIESSIR